MPGGASCTLRALAGTMVLGGAFLAGLAGQGAHVAAFLGAALLLHAVAGGGRALDAEGRLPAGWALLLEGFRALTVAMAVWGLGRGAGILLGALALPDALPAGLALTGVALARLAPGEAGRCPDLLALVMAALARGDSGGSGGRGAPPPSGRDEGDG